ncbi:TetR/AcrR family transcriptional regulator [Streptomyces sp. JJ36]|uniref:TetR/AcrR family transcriptional regulator n=1 Tax=Streptomyces sp. JJ36 TaxID=2736645 RepID=UPI001F43C6EC|nr:TetR/AcrR family transcriptional regulator [Streptomyces sp. JJ36]MCF6524803.1 TetR/AcrR family transcriptional regulator [Streptomyces sp. JJ36]
MRTPPPDLTDRLLNASAELLRTEDPPQLTEAARLVGVARATLYYYFAGREDLLAFILAAHVREGGQLMAAADDEALPAPDRLRAVLTAMCSYLGTRPFVCTGLLTAAGAGGRMHEVLAANDAVIGAHLRRILQEGLNAGTLGDTPQPSLDATDIADAANAAMGAILLAVLGRAAATLNTTEPDFATKAAARVVDGLRAR